MNSRKRCAPEPEHDSKHPRLASGPQNLAASAPEEGRLLKRWAMVSKQLIELVVDTATTLVPATLSVWQPVPPPLSDDAMSSSSATSSSPVSTPRQTPTPHNSNNIAVIHESTTPTQCVSAPIHSPTSPNFLEHFNNEPVLDGVVFSTPKPQKHQISGSQPGTASSSQCTPDRTLNRDVVPHLTSLHLEGASSSRQSSQASQSSSSLINSTLGSEISRQDKPSKYHPLRRNPRQREHILAKSHKQYVAREKTKMRDEVIHLKRELYRVKRKSGYSSGFDDLQGLLDYQRTLESLDLERDSRRSASLLHPRTPKAEPASEEAFLQRVLDNAKATLNSPKPAKPYAPSLEQLQIKRRLKDEAIDKMRMPPPLPTTLPPEEEEEVKTLFRKRGVVAKFAKEQVSETDLSRLRPGQWLNDEIINFYGAMILARSEGSKENQDKSNKKLLNIHYFSSFFWTKLTRDGYEKGRLAKWTKKIDIFSKDAIILPVNHGNAHWTAAAINFRQKRFESYDSMLMAKERVFKALRAYVNDEHMNKKKKPFDFDGWEDYAPDDTPQQENGYDCGVFTCQFMAALSRGEPFNFSQKDMPYLRRRMVWEIGNAKLRDS